MTLLEVEHVEIRYGQVPAVKDLSISVEDGEIVTLLGANGAGKTTTLRMLSGLHRPAKGTVTFDGVDLTRLVAHSIVQLGIGHVPEGRRIFPVMTVAENLEMGAYHHRRGHHSGDALAEVFELFPVLQERRQQLGGDLSGGEQQMLAIGRALMGEPRLLLLDEPSMGLAPLMVETIFSIITKIRDRGVTILLVEQNAAKALAVADRGYVLETGSVVLADAAAVLLADDRVRMAYLGEDLTT
ncbi:MAG TPA: ABC transporter ATP-binding protein [Acidimicrobiales bacterium]|jgi:branched-chain amino acid transport system ATP-binding protein|nr:ABC transporter ATP-binding protein [Acidimicrobiales bacterium]